MDDFHFLIQKTLKYMTFHQDSKFVSKTGNASRQFPPQSGRVGGVIFSCPKTALEKASNLPPSCSVFPSLQRTTIEIKNIHCPRQSSSWAKTVQFRERLEHWAWWCPSWIGWLSHPARKPLSPGLGYACPVVLYKTAKVRPCPSPPWLCSSPPLLCPYPPDHGHTSPTMAITSLTYWWWWRCPCWWLRLAGLAALKHPAPGHWALVVALGLS